MRLSTAAVSALLLPASRAAVLDDAVVSFEGLGTADDALVVPVPPSSSSSSVGGDSGGGPGTDGNESIPEIVSLTERARRAQESNPFDLFEPNPCNDAVAYPCATPFSTLAASVGQPVVIPPCECVLYDMVGDLTLDSGLDIQGVLEFPDNHQAHIRTPFVFVQGVLKVRNSLPVSSGSPGVTVELTGASDVAFVPASWNEGGCSGDVGCDVGPRAVVVAGGRLDVDAFPAACPAWSPVLDVEPDPVVAYSPVPGEGIVPGGCPRAFADDDFAGGAGDWRGHLGTEHGVEIDGGGDTCLRVDRRLLDYQGPYLDLAERKVCAQTDQKYIFSARIKLTKEGGGQSDCSQLGTNCPKLVLGYKVIDGTDGGPGSLSNKVTMLPVQGTATTDGEWFGLADSFEFYDSEVADNVFMTFSVQGPEAGVTIDMTDVYIGLPEEGMYPPPGSESTVCDELFTAHPSADGYLDPPKYPFPLYSNRSPSRLIVATETEIIDGVETENSFYRLLNREQQYESLSFPVPPGCVPRGAQYEVTFRMRINDSRTFKRVIPEFRAKGTNSWKSQGQWCPPMGGNRGWVTCTSGLLIEDAEDRDDIYFRIDTQWYDGANEQDVNLDLDYDDISVRLVHGPIRGLVVEQEAAQCWGPGSEVMVTSHTINYNEEQLGVIAPQGTTTAGRTDGNALVRLSESIFRPVTAADDPKAPTEVALLSRNVRFVTDDETTEEGGHLIVVGTSGVAQMLRGAEFNNFGQKVANRFAVHLHMNTDIDGTVISKNLIRNSNRRCINIKGTHNATIYDNVAYNTKGHCFVLDDGKEEGNTLERNLGARTLDGVDSNVATFFLRSPRNYIVDNVAAGSRRRGIFYDPPSSIQSLSKDLPGPNFNPQREHIAAFSGNVAHSNDDYGVYIDRHYPSGGQDLHGLRVFRNEEDGILLRAQNTAIVGAYIADNRVDAFDLYYCDSCSIADSEIVGFSDAFRDLVVAQNIWHQCFDEENSSNRVVGIDSLSWFSSTSNSYPGLKLTNVHFSKFEDSGCKRPVHFQLDSYVKLQHYEVLTQLENITTDDSHFLLDGCSGEDKDVQDILFTDLDSSLHPDGPNTFSGPSAIVSDHPWMKGFSNGPCTSFPDYCHAYCENSCLRFVNFNVDAYGTEDVLLRVEDRADPSRYIEVPGNWRCDGRTGGTNCDVSDNSYYTDYRVFSAPLPAGEYNARFVLNGQDYWPTFVEIEYEHDPDCGGVQEGSIAVQEPPVTAEECQELVMNGDLEADGGNYTGWYHISGGLAVELGSGVDNTAAIVTTSDRDSIYEGLVFYVDTRCLSLMVGKEYELTAMYKAEGTDFVCDPDDDSETNGCPRFTARTKKDGKTESWYNIAKSVRPASSDGYTLAHGTFVISQEMAEADSLMFYFTRTKASAKIFLDNVSLHPLETSTRNYEGCPGDLIVNGDMEDLSGTTKYWDTRFDYEGKLSLTTGVAGNGIQVAGRTSKSQGPRQWLNPTCFEDIEYQVFLRFKLTDSASNTIVCNANSAEGESDACPTAKVYAIDPDGNEAYTSIGSVSDVGTEMDWGIVHGLFTPNEVMRNAFRAFFYVNGPASGVDIAIDDVAITFYVLDCSNLVLNGDFERGDGLHWGYYGANNAAITGYETGANATSLSLIMTGRDERWWGMEQKFNNDCVHAQDQYQVTAYVRMEQDGSSVACDSNLVNGDDSCPVAMLVSKDGGEERKRVIAAVVGSADADGWYYMQGIFEFYDYNSASEDVYVRFQDAPANVNLIVDEVKIVKVEILEE